MRPKQTLRERVAAFGPLAGRDLDRLAREAAALVASPLAPLGPDTLSTDEVGRWTLSTAGDPPPAEGWEPFEAAAGRPNTRSGLYRYGAVLFFAATGLPPSAAGLPFEYREPDGLGAMPPGVREALRRLLSPEWQSRPTDPYEALRLLEDPSAAPRPVQRTAVGAQAGGFLAAFLAVLIPLGLSLTPSRPPAGQPPTPATLEQAFPFLKPLLPPQSPSPTASFADAGAAARSLLQPGQGSGELRRLVLDGQDHVYIRGRQVHPEAPGCTSEKGDQALERTQAGWVLTGAYGGPEALPPLPVEQGEDTLCAFAGYARVMVAPGPGRGLWLFHDGRWEQVRDPSVLREPGARINSLAQAGYGEIWAALTPPASGAEAGYSVVQLDGASYEVIGPQQGLSSKGTLALTTLGRSDAVAATDGRVIFLRKHYFTTKAYAFAADFAGPVRRISVDGVNGRLLLLGAEGLSVVGATGSRRVGRGSLPAGAKELGVDADGRTWVLGERVLILPKGAL